MKKKPYIPRVTDPSNPVTALIAAFGNRTIMAAETGATYSGVWYWEKVGYIPRNNHHAVMRAAVKYRIPLTYDHLEEMISRAGPKPQGGEPIDKVRAEKARGLYKAGLSPKEIALKLDFSYPTALRLTYDLRNSA